MAVITITTRPTPRRRPTTSPRRPAVAAGRSAGRHPRHLLASPPRRRRPGDRARARDGAGGCCARGCAPLATPERRPAIARVAQQVVVQPGDSLWSVAAAPRSRRATRGQSSTRLRRPPRHALGAGRDRRVGRLRIARRRPGLCAGPGGCARVGERRRIPWRGALPVLLDRRRQGRRLAPGRRRRRGPAPARVPGVRAAVHHLRAGRGAAARGGEALGRRRSRSTPRSSAAASSGRWRAARSTRRRSRRWWPRSRSAPRRRVPRCRAR